LSEGAVRRIGRILGESPDELNPLEAAESSQRPLLELSTEQEEEPAASERMDSVSRSHIRRPSRSRWKTALFVVGTAVGIAALTSDFHELRAEVVHVTAGAGHALTKVSELARGVVGSHETGTPASRTEQPRISSAVTPPAPSMASTPDVVPLEGPMQPKRIASFSSSSSGNDSEHTRRQTPASRRAPSPRVAPAAAAPANPKLKLPQASIPPPKFSNPSPSQDLDHLIPPYSDH
jgi:hypothetical protein